jgi:hypothetical protein
MIENFQCEKCNQLISRAHVNDGKFYCVQCLSHSWEISEECEALFLMDSAVEVTEVEVLNETLVVR